MYTFSLFISMIACRGSNEGSTELKSVDEAAVATETDTNGNTEDADNGDASDWWETESDDGDGDGEEQSEEDEKPDDYYEEKPEEDAAGTIFEGILNLGTMEGVYTVEYTNESLDTCVRTYAFTAVESTECSACSAAFVLTMGDSEDEGGDAACSELEDLSGTTLSYGQGTSSFGVYEGIEYFSLIWKESAAWAELAAGYSYSQDDEWIFSVK